MMARPLALRLAVPTAERLFLRPATAGLDLKRGAEGNAATSVPLQGSPGNIRTEADLPVVTLPGRLYRLIFQRFYNIQHELQLYEMKQYGPMFKVNVGGSHIVLSTVELLEELLRKDEKFPSRGDMAIWTEYRDMKGLGYGPFTESGEKWYKLRAVLNKRMLHPKDSAKYEHVVNDVVTDFVKKIHRLRKMSPTGDMVSNLSNELYCFSLEGIASILFETRIGCLEDKIPAETQHFIDSIARMFTYALPGYMLPKWSRKILPFWQWYLDGWEGIFKFACKLIDKKMDEIQKRIDSGKEIEGEYLTYLLSNTNMDKKDVYGSIAELLLAGVDTTSNTLVWAFYMLSRDPKAQEALYKEITTMVKGEIPTAQEVNSMPYLKAVIKETLRMYPVVPLNARLLSGKDLEIGGHFFNKETTFVVYHYAISRDETTFLDPETFKPERWLRDGRVRPNPFGAIPFGFGVRGCVGRRIAELEMYLALARIIKHFEIKPDPKVREVKAINRTVLVPDRQVNFRFVERT